MGLISRIRGRKTALTNQADKRSEAEYPRCYNCNTSLKVVLTNNTEVKCPNCQVYIDRKWLSQELAQRLPQAIAQDKPSMNATRKEWQNHGE